MFYNLLDLEKRAKSKSLTESASIYKFASIEKSINSTQSFDIFLSHSYLDAKYIEIIMEDLMDLGYSVYVDWVVDKQLNRKEVTKETAETLRQRMKQCRSLFYAITENYSNSKWMPWELGYFDALKQRVAILPVKNAPDTSEKYKGTEYLGLYHYVTLTRNKDGQEVVWVNKSEEVYISFDQWISGKEPYLRN
ncbi:TIR domain-containing protein [Candidatus Clostridium radicumherbarum]|uniref:TIR domain-containing protein n=1 Tax=Candidatus Clostridium radicumherbarum TaxID=3381662 RepID=A0ABW8U0Z2_9CLOT